MANNYDRYSTWDHRKMNRKGLSYYIYRRDPDTVIFPLINALKNKKILEVGVGAGYYTSYFQRNGCAVTGVDINPHLGSHLGIEIVKACADDFSSFFTGKTFDIVASFWMTEYLSEQSLKGFIAESLKVLRPGGVFITTIPQNRGLGKLHVFLSALKRIEKFHYAAADFLPFYGSAQVTVQSLCGMFGLPYSQLVCATKP